MAHPPLMISVSGLRGVVGDGLTPPRMAAFAALAAAALRQVAESANRPSDGPIVVTRDPRPHGAMLAQAATAGLRGAGHAVLDGEIAATPTVGVLVRQLEALGAVQITASHNPAEWNGAKIFTADGRVLSGTFAEELAERFRATIDPDTGASGNADIWADWQRVGDERALPDPHQPHLDAVLRHVDAAAIAARAPHVVLDANHGAGAILGPRLLERLGCRVTLLGCEADGQFAHPPEPLEQNLRGLCEQVVRHRADVGFALDPDADRLAVVDETGRYLGEEYTLALVVDHVLSHRSGPVVTNVSSSKTVEDLAERHGCPCYRAKVGEANVVDKMLAVAAVIGGEGNGGVIDPRIGMVRDGFVAMALILEALAKRCQSLGSSMAELPRYAMVKQKIAVDAPSFAQRVPALLEAFTDAHIDRTDGLRFAWPDRWLHVRPSNTEPVVRVIAEATSAEQSEHLCREARRLLELPAKYP